MFSQCLVYMCVDCNSDLKVKCILFSCVCYSLPDYVQRNEFFFTDNRFHTI